MRPAGAWLILALLLTSVPAGAWEQLRGGPERAGLALVPEAPLDVVLSRNVLQEGEDMRAPLGPNLALTPRGLVGVARDNETLACTMVLVGDAGKGEVRRTPLDGCEAPWFQGYDPVNDAVLLCNIQPGDQPILQARALDDGRLLWGVRPAQDLGAPDLNPTFIWACSGAAIDFATREVVAPFINGRWGPDIARHRIASIDLDTGAPRWVSQIPTTSPVTGGLVPIPTVDGAAPDYIPIAITLTVNGAVVTGVLVCPDVATCDIPPTDGSRPPTPFQTGVAWMTRDGQVRGMALGRHDVRSPDPAGDLAGRTAAGAFWAAGAGTLAAASMGGYVVVINPENRDWLASAPLGTVESSQWGLDPLASPIWSAESIVVPFYRSVTAFHPVDLSKRWAWAMREGGWLVLDLAASATDDIFVLLGRTERSTQAGQGLQGTEAMLVKLDGDTGAELQRVPFLAESWMVTEPVMTIPVAEQGLFFPRGPVLVPLPGGLAVSDLRGNLVVLEWAPPEMRPSLALSNPWPQPGERVRLAIDGPTPPMRALVRWGDGSVEDVSSPGPGSLLELEHAYGEPDRHELLVTAVYGDGRTGTSTAIVDVGGTRPPELGLLQQAFAPENQDLTFGVLGLGLAVMGGLYAGSMRRRHRGRLTRAMDEVDATFAAHRDRPAECEARLGTLREHHRGEMRRGRLLEAQFAVIDAHIDDLLRQNRRRLLEDRVAFLPHGMVLTLQKLLADGRVSAWERRQFLAALDREAGLTPAQRAAVGRLLADLASEEDAPSGGAKPS